ncbi:MAG: hypothetical protein NUV94_05570 [Candidatus Acetothermia bacterium]|jgi:hypothetical protein|nr:hypothetical protein [Candidatus Acetothermia bacterium]
MGAIVVIAGVLLVAFFWWRWNLRLSRTRGRVEEAWQELAEALAARIRALETLLEALRAAGYVPEGQARLREALDAFRRAQGEGPRVQAEADDRVQTVLRQIYRALPRERTAEVRAAQNGLAEADEELDIARNRYNDLALGWFDLTRGFPYRWIVRLKKLPSPELFLLRSQEEEFGRRHMPMP